MAKILLVDDEESIRITIGEFIRESGHEVHTAENVEIAFELINAENFDVIVTDIIMPKITGIELLRKIHETSPDIPIIMMTGEPEVRSASEAVRAGAFDYLSKPISSEAITKVIRNATERKRLNDEKERLEEENRNYQMNLEEMVEERTRKMRESEEKFRTLFDESIDGIYLTNIEGILMDCNPALLNIFGYSKEEMLGIDFSNFYVDPRDRDKFKNIISENGFVRNFEVKLLRKNATRIDCGITSVARWDSNGNIIGIQGIIRDITDRKKTEAELAQHRHRLEELVEERTSELKMAQQKLLWQERLATLGQIAGSISHELRNPMASMNNATYLIRLILEDPDPDVEKSLAIIEKEIQDSTKIIEMLLDFSRPPQDIKGVADVNESLASTLLGLDIPEAVDVSSELDDDLPEIRGDSFHLKHAFHNIILNGIQAMSEGGILTIHTSTSEEDDVEVTITDTGVGMSEAVIRDLYEPLFSTKAKGIGLGLPLAKNLIELMKGTIAVESKEGEGSTFTITFPTSNRSLPDPSPQTSKGDRSND